MSHEKGTSLKRLAWLYGCAGKGTAQETRARLYLLEAAAQELTALGRERGTEFVTEAISRAMTGKVG